MVGDTVEERPVVAGDHERSGPVVEERFERTQGVEIEVVGRLVEDEQVRLGGEHHHELQPATLTTRQHPHRRVLRRGVEPEALEQGAVLEVGFSMGAGDELAHDGVGRQLGRVLVGEPDHDGLASAHLAGGRLATPGDDVEQRRLA